MEEKKKRWRPSLKAYRELEEVIHRQCVELDAWREKFHGQRKAFNELMTEHEDILARLREQLEIGFGLSQDAKSMMKEVDEISKCMRSLREKNVTLEQSNALLEDELRRLRSGDSRYEDEIRRLTLENERLVNRGFWGRVFNK